ncbi:MAG: hypothetical protein R8K22_07410 [Mariprofundaceae bacterium]
MSKNTSSNRPEKEDSEQFLSTLSFELEQDIRLVSKQAHHEKNNAIIDIIRIQFVDLYKKLDSLTFASTEEERKGLSKEIRAWINSLNEAPLIPLPFRLKTLKQIEGYLEILSKDMPGLILRAYKVGIIHVKDKARQDPELYGEIVHVTATALQLAIHQLVDYAVHHYSPTPIEVHHNLDIAKLGLLVARSAPKTCKDEAIRLKCIVAEHELLRRIDMFAHTMAEKKIIVKKLHHYAMFMDSLYVRKGKHIPYKKRGMYLITYLHKPHLKPHRTTNLPKLAPDDIIIMYVQGMGKVAITDLDKVREAELMASRNGSLNLETELEETKVICLAIINAFKIQERQKRQSVAKKKVSIGILLGIDTSADDSIDKKLKKGWVLHNLSNHGAMLQCPIKEGVAIPVRSILTFYWSKDSKYPRYAIVKWVQASLQGYQRLGVEFMQGTVKPATLHFINVQSAIMNKRDWPALLIKFSLGWQVWMQTKEHHHTPLTVSIETGGTADNDICRIYPMQEYGYNYSVFHITEVLSMEEIKAMALMHGKQEKKSIKDLNF